MQPLKSWRRSPLCILLDRLIFRSNDTCGRQGTFTGTCEKATSRSAANVCASHYFPTTIRRPGAELTSSVTSGEDISPQFVLIRDPDKIVSHNQGFTIINKNGPAEHVLTSVWFMVQLVVFLSFQAETWMSSYTLAEAPVEKDQHSHLSSSHPEVFHPLHHVKTCNLPLMCQHSHAHLVVWHDGASSLQLFKCIESWVWVCIFGSCPTWHRWRRKAFELKCRQPL